MCEKYIRGIMVLGVYTLGLVGVTASERPQAELPTRVVTASRTERDMLREPYAVHRVETRDFAAENYHRTLAEAMDSLPSVMVQKTGHGQTSPYLRGFTGYQTLLLVDGIRLNNSVFRSGPNQYWNTVDNMGIDSVEVVMGPASVLYGSDAIGGLANALTISPPEWSGAPTWQRNVRLRLSTAEQAQAARLSFSGSPDEKWGIAGGLTYKNFGDVKGGSEVGRQRNTGYDEYAADLKISRNLWDGAMLTFAHQAFSQSDAPRTHKTIYGIDWKGLDHGSELVRDFDQRRALSYLRLDSQADSALADAIQLTLSHHYQGEIQHRIRGDYRSDRQGFDVHTFGAALQMVKSSLVGLWVYGADYYRDRVDTFSRNYSASGETGREAIQGPVADNSYYDLAGLFVQNTQPLLHEKLELTLGARATYAAADVGRFEDPTTGYPASLDEDWSSLDSSARLSAALDKNRNHVLYTGLTRGFRAPNLSDLTRLDEARSNEIEVPSPGLDPEKFWTAEFGWKTEFDIVRAQFAYYYTWIDGMIIRTPTGNMRDGSFEVNKENSGDGFVHGLEFSGAWQTLPDWNLWWNLSWQEGRVDTYPGSLTAEKTEDVLSRSMPLSGSAGLRHTMYDKRAFIEFSLQAAAKANRLSERDRSDTQRIPPGGTPGYAVCALRAGLRPVPQIELALALENLFDEDYRIHGSGINEPGRNLVFSSCASF